MANPTDPVTRPVLYPITITVGTGDNSCTISINHPNVTHDGLLREVEALIEDGTDPAQAHLTGQITRAALRYLEGLTKY